MIFVTDKGRLGNNIFQYGQLYAWGREHGRTTMSMRFAHMYPDFKIAHTRYHNPIVYIAVKLAAKLHIIPTVNFDGSDNHQIETLQAHKHILATGWIVRFQDLFEKYRKEITDLFDFSDKVKNAVEKRMSGDAPGTIRLGVHVRRGDYATWMGGKFFFNDTQFINVIQQTIRLHPNKQVVVYICSNDPKLDQEKFRRELPMASAVYFPGGSPAEDLCLLSNCDYIMGPPSSFTLIASMYHDSPLFWMVGTNCQVQQDSFRNFDYQARHFDEIFSDC